MKLPKAYYQQINEAITQNQMPLQFFSLIKKKGWIYINHSPSEQFFSFFRKKTVEISTENHQWEQKELFKSKTSSGKITEYHNWEQVLTHFTSWLNEL